MKVIFEFMKKVYDSAMFISEYLGWDKVDCNENNKMKSIDEIHQKVYRLVKSKKTQFMELVFFYS